MPKSTVSLADALLIFLFVMPQTGNRNLTVKLNVHSGVT